MECLLAFLLIFVGMAALAGVSVWTRWQGGSETSLKTLAQRYAGQFTAGGWFKSPMVHFQYGYDRVPVVVYLSTESGRQYSHIVIEWPDPSLRCEILSRWAYQPSQFEGLEEVAVQAEFNQRFVVLANDAVAARALLVQPVRWRVESLRAMFGDDFVHISFQQGDLQIVKQGALPVFSHADAFVRGASDFFDQCMLTRSVGIEFVGGNDVQVVSEAICQVCGEEVITDMVFCCRCKTPHHIECWQYVGNCAIYGCQEKRFTTPRIAETKAAPDWASRTEEGEPSG